MFQNIMIATDGSDLAAKDVEQGVLFVKEIGTRLRRDGAEHRSGSPLTRATMADAYNSRVGGYFDAHGTTRAMRGSRHSSPPSSAWARLQEGSYQSDPLLSIVLLALRSLGGRIGGAPGRCSSRFAKQMAGNV